MAWMAKPTSRATSSACSTEPSVRADSSVVGMRPRRKSVVPPLPSAVVASSAPCPRTASDSCRPSPGWSRLPTTRPIASATVDMTMK